MQFQTVSFRHHQKLSDHSPFHKGVYDSDHLDPVFSSESVKHIQDTQVGGICAMRHEDLMGCTHTHLI